MEAHISTVPCLGTITENYYNNVFGPELTQALTDIFGRDSKYLIREFLFGLDCLVELVNDPKVPKGKFLNNSDVDERLVEVCQKRARMENKQEYFGCQVNPATMDLIEEFFEHKYLRLITFVLAKVNSHLPVKVNDGTYLLYITKEWSTQTNTSVIYFRDMENEENRISIPFHRKRTIS